MYRIEPDMEVTLAHPVFQGAWGVLGGTRCRVLSVGKQAKPEDPIILTLLPLPSSNGLALRVPAHDTLEGIVNIQEGRIKSMETDVLTTLQALDSIQEKYPEAAKAVLEFCLLKMSPEGKNLALHRPDKPTPGGKHIPEGKDKKP